MSLSLPDGFKLTAGTRVHSSDDPRLHLSGTLDGSVVHLPYYGQTTLGMFDHSLGGDSLSELNQLHADHPDLFRHSGF